MADLIAKRKVTKELIKRLSAYPSNYGRKITPLPLLGLILGLIIGIAVDLKIFKLVYADASLKTLFFSPLSKINVLNYPKYGSIFSNVIAYPMFFALVGILVGKGLEVLIKRLIKKS